MTPGNVGLGVRVDKISNRHGDVQLFDDRGEESCRSMAADEIGVQAFPGSKSLAPRQYYMRTGSKWKGSVTA